jgi:hypothetical protein
MTRVATIPLLAGLLAALAGPSAAPAATNQAPDFQEIYSLIRAHAAGVSDAELNRAAVQGLVNALSPKVSLSSNNTPTKPPVEIPLLGPPAVFEDDIACLRVRRVGDGLAAAVRSACQRLSSTNRLSGLVLDLRYADGTDYAAAVAVADLFVTKSAPLLNWGDGMVNSHEKTDAIRLPVVVLVNHETARAAEALAALVRQTGTGLVLGNPTAGQAMVMQDFPLKDGEHLRIATVPVTLGNGSTLSAQGIKPDISVSVSPENERTYYADAFAVLPAASSPDGTAAAGTSPTNTVSLAPHRGRLNEAELVRQHKQGPVQNASSSSPARMSEAELVREHKQGIDPDGDADEAPAPQPEVAAPMVNDPVLARALDLLKGLAVIQQNHF